MIDRFKSLALSTVSLAAVVAGTMPAAAATCESLATLSLPHATITAAQSVTGGSFTPPGSTVAQTGLPPFCRVAGVSTPTSDSSIKFETWIPMGSSWNGKYEQLGNGGFAGSISYAGLATGIKRGYATSGTDDGHTGSALDATWALNHPEKIVDFGYRALKETTDKSRAIINAFAGHGPSRSYFAGCSDGGREALMEAQRYPDDWDGIIIGSPANFWTHLLTGFIFNEQALLDNPASYLQPAQLAVLTTAALKQCAAREGLGTDPFPNDPRDCHFDPATVQCTAGQDPTTCLSAPQVAAAKAIYDGPRSSRTHQQIFPGYEAGTEAVAADWPAWITGATPGTSLQDAFGNQFYANMVLSNPSFDFRSLNIDSGVALADAEMAPILNSTNPDLRRSKHRGTKLIHYVGWADSAIAPINSINYYHSVAIETDHGKLDETAEYYRLFMAPGMAHCSGGVGANSFGNSALGLAAGMIDPDHDILAALDRWVEHGVAPDKIIATKFVNDTVASGIAFQRPLCPYPQIAAYKGTGPATAASSFACVEDKDDAREDRQRARQYLEHNERVLFNPPSGDDD